MEFNKTLTAITPSKSVTLLSKAKAMQKVDPEIINLTGGDPDFATPQAICDEAAKWMKAGYTHYVDGQGDLELRERLAKKLLEENNAPYKADQIVITPGGKYAIYLAVRALLNEGDEAVWLTPGWVSYPSIVQASGGVPKQVDLHFEDDFAIHREALEAVTTEKTKLLLLNSPNNPTGKVMSAEDMQVLRAYLNDHPQIYVISDEMYEKIIYDGHVCISLASYPELFERVIVVNGFSKSSAMTGWRLGYLACNRELCRVIMKLAQHTLSCVSGFLQKGAIVALDLPEETEHMRQAYERRRDLIAEGMKKIPGVTFHTPDGAFYAWVRFDVNEDSETLCNALLDEAKIAGVPGGAYGPEDGTYIRFSFAASDEDLKEALKRLQVFMENYKK